MKSIKLTVMACIFAISATTFANNPTDRNSENAKLSFEIQNILKKTDLVLTDEVTAMVKITLNKNREIVVLSIDKGSEAVKAFIKNKLNYKKISSNYVGKDKTFIVPVRLVPES